MATKFPEFWSALGRPIPRDLVKERTQGGRRLSYITARTVLNRLDAVVGPENWWATFAPWGDNGVQCCLTIRTPDDRTVTKCDVGGFAGMSDAGDDEKSGASDALKRAAIHFGIGRELYGDGNAVAELRELSGSSPPPDGGQSSSPPTGRGDQLSRSGDRPTDREAIDRPTSFGKPVGTVIDDETARRGSGGFVDVSDFDAWVDGVAVDMTTEEADMRNKRRLPQATAPMTREDVAIECCVAGARAGKLNPASFQVDGRPNPAACLEILRQAHRHDAVMADQRARDACLAAIQSALGNRNGGPNGRNSQNAAGGDYGAPQSGRALFAAAKELGERHGVDVVKFINGFAAANGFPKRMADFDADQVARAYAEATRKIRAMNPDHEGTLAEALSS